MIESLKSVSGDYFLNVIKELLDKMNISKFDT
jgi:hypothetical protein